jgi:hypothetical protein
VAERNNRGSESRGNGSSRASRPAVGGRNVVRGAGDVLGELESLIDEATRLAREQVRERPYTALGVAAGVGWALGGGLASPLTRILLSQGSRLALTMAMSRLVGATTSDSERSTQ